MGGSCRIGITSAQLGASQGVNFVAERLSEGISCLPMEWNEEETEHRFSNTPCNAVFERFQPADDLTHISFGSPDVFATQHGTHRAHGDDLEPCNQTASVTKRIVWHSTSA